MALTLNQYLKEQEKIIEGVPRQFFGEVKKQQSRIFKSIEQQIELLALDEAGNIIPNQTNIAIIDNILSDLRTVFWNTEYLNAVQKISDAFDRSVELTDEWMTQVFDLERLTELKSNALALMELSKRNAVELLIGESAINTAFFEPIRQTLTDGIANGQRITQLSRNLRETVRGTDDVQGRLLRYTKQIAADAVATGDRNYSKNLGDSIGVEFYRYSGGLISDSRDFCVERNGKYYHRKEVEKWGRTPQSWQGRFRGTDPKTIFTWLGGYNCKHSIIPVSTVRVPKDQLERAIRLGFYKPSKEEKRQLGLVV